MEREKIIDLALKNTAAIERLWQLGVLKDGDSCRDYNVGASDYSAHLIQAWTLWIEYEHLTPFDHDILKRILRNKNGESRRMDYEKVIHICKERIRQIDAGLK